MKKVFSFIFLFQIAFFCVLVVSPPALPQDEADQQVSEVEAKRSAEEKARQARERARSLAEGEAARTGPLPAQRKVLIFAGNDKFAPYSFYSNGEVTGYAVDLTKILAATMDRSIDIRLMPWHKCIQQLKAGKIDGIIGVPVSEERERFMEFSTPVTEIEFAIFVEAANHYVNSLKSLEGTVVAVHKESLIIDTLSRFPRIRLVETDSVQEALEKLNNREVTAVIAEKNVALYYIQHAAENIKGIKIVGAPLKPVYPYAIAVKEGSGILLRDINRGLQVLQNNNTMEKLRRKWFGLHLAEPFPWKMVTLMTSGITLLLFILAGILWVISLNATVKAKTRQIQLMSEKMVEKDKLAVLGKLAGQIAHELRTPLSIINNSVFLLRKEGSKNMDLFEKRLKVLEDKIKLSSNILESILSYSRVKAEIATQISVKSCVEEVLKDIEIPEGIETRAEYEKPEKLMVFMDFHQLYSVIRNLVLNALQAMGETGKLTIEAFRDEASGMVNVRVCDTGKGILESSRNKIFNLFYSTKITGTGLGLPISKSIIEANDGQLLLEETSKKGTCFIVKLPTSMSMRT
ncbi:MAG: transporter substrate-binding domain-containing protein [Candidatus Omnitrophica bacterium]|nr:transporter substrate-binding domain-containing protein [Candidatus Omnitrophota bacterium]